VYIVPHPPSLTVSPSTGFITSVVNSWLKNSPHCHAILRERKQRASLAKTPVVENVGIVRGYFKEQSCLIGFIV
jgi:hypothetical protein